jgi:hypothetical protein
MTYTKIVFPRGTVIEPKSIKFRKFDAFLKNVPGAGLEPARPKRTQDFKSCVSTNSTTPAKSRDVAVQRLCERETGFEPATSTLARSRSTN